MLSSRQSDCELQPRGDSWIPAFEQAAGVRSADEGVDYSFDLDIVNVELHLRDLAVKTVQVDRMVIEGDLLGEIVTARFNVDDADALRQEHLLAGEASADEDDVTVVDAGILERVAVDVAADKIAVLRCIDQLVRQEDRGGADIGVREIEDPVLATRLPTFDGPEVGNSDRIAVGGGTGYLPLPVAFLFGDSLSPPPIIGLPTLTRVGFADDGRSAAPFL